MTTADDPADLRERDLLHEVKKAEVQLKLTLPKTVARRAADKVLNRAKYALKRYRADRKRNEAWEAQRQREEEEANQPPAAKPIDLTVLPEDYGTW